MATKTIEKIIKTVHEIPEDRRGELLDLVKEFKKKGGAKRGGKWAEFAGILTDEEARIMKAAIEEAFEKVEDEM